MRILSFLVLLSSGAVALGQSTLAQWTFETSVPAATDQSSITGINPEIGSGTASGLHASAATDYSNPVGNGTPESFSANNWADGDYYQFEVSTVGFTDVQLSWQQTRSSTGPAAWDFAYSLNGIDFTIVLDNYNVDPITWSSVTFTNVSGFAVDLTPVDTLENAPAVYFRITAATAPSSTLGTSRLDDFTVIAVPEPGTPVLFLAGAALLGGVFFRRRRATPGIRKF